jgi:hypothetical protein
MKTRALMSLFAAAAVGRLAAADYPTHTTLTLSSARRDLGAAVANGAVVFGGGCTNWLSKFTCQGASKAVDVFQETAGKGWKLINSSATLSEARGWPSTCAIGDTVAFLGGGRTNSEPHSQTLDLFDVVTGTMRSNHSALDEGRWGTACVTSPQGVFFAGGKEVNGTEASWKMTAEVLSLPGGTPALDGLQKAPGGWELSIPREAASAVAMGSFGVLFAGGWVSVPMPGRPVARVDTWELQSGHRHTWDLPAEMEPKEYWIGGAPWDEHTLFLADSRYLYKVLEPPLAPSTPHQTLRPRR